MVSGGKTPTRALYYAVDRAMFPPAIFSAHTAISQSRKNTFDTIIAVPERTIPSPWIEWAESQVGVVVKEVPFQMLVRLQKTANLHLPPSVTFRYHFPEFAGGYDRLIYLDADTRIVGDISPLFDLDLGGHAFGAVRDAYFVAGANPDFSLRDYLAGLELPPETPYFNSGVLVLDPLKWAADELTLQMSTFLASNTEACFLADQSALNVVVQSSYQNLSPIWNTMFPFWINGLGSVIEPVVLHYVGAMKPWKPLKWRHDETKEIRHYRAFFRNSPYRDFIGSFFSVGDFWMHLRHRRRHVLRKLRGKTPYSPIPADAISRYAHYLSHADFADLAQGIVDRSDGMLRARV